MQSSNGITDSLTDSRSFVADTVSSAHCAADSEPHFEYHGDAHCVHVVADRGTHSGTEHRVRPSRSGNACDRTLCDVQERGEEAVDVGGDGGGAVAVGDLHRVLLSTVDRAETARVLRWRNVNVSEEADRRSFGRRRG